MNHLTIKSSANRSQDGVAIVEFLITFPLFLVVCLFAIEISLIWSDKHIMRLAAFEAARVYVAAAPTEFWDEDGVRRSDASSPCTSPEVKKRAKGAALRKMAIIAMPFDLWTQKLGAATGLNITIPAVPASVPFSKQMTRLASRWPAAAAFTTIGCDYSPKTKTVSVRLTYDRVGQTPIIDQAMYFLHKLTTINAKTDAKYDLDPMFMKVVGTGPDLARNLEQKRDELKKSFETLKTTMSSTGEHSNVDVLSSFLQASPLGSAFSELPSFGNFEGSINATADAAQNSLNALVSNSAVALNAVLFAMPEAFRTIPISTQVQLTREFMSHQGEVDGEGSIQEAKWAGNLNYLMTLDGEYREYAKKLSQPNLDVVLETK